MRRSRLGRHCSSRVSFRTVRCVDGNTKTNRKPLEDRCAAARPKTFMKYTAIIDGRSIDLELSRGEAKIIEAEIRGEKYVLDVENLEPGVYLFHWNNRS